MNSVSTSGLGPPPPNFPLHAHDLQSTKNQRDKYCVAPTSTFSVIDDGSCFLRTDAYINHHVQVILQTQETITIVSQSNVTELEPLPLSMVDTLQTNLFFSE